MKTLLTITTIWVAGLTACGAAFAQSAAPITEREVSGDWRLMITPAQGQGRTITFKARDGSQRLDFPLAIATRPNGRLNCTVSGEPAECRIRNGELRIISTGDGVSMIFTLTGRAGAGFTGAADLRVRLMPYGGRIGSVNMARR